jgi:DNA-binding beta-propeller fold protein YncE
MMKTIHCFTRTAARRRLMTVAAALLLGTLACRKENPQAPASGGEKQAPTPQPTETAAPERRPTILSKAEGNRAPFSGMRGPRSVAVDEKGRLWVADVGNNTIQIFDANGGLLGGWGSRGSGNYGLKEPCGIAVRGDEVYVADTWNGRVELFSASGEWKAKAPGDFYGPRSIAATSDGKVWISDTGNQRLVRIERDLSNPRWFGKHGSGPEEFSSPMGVAAGPGGSVYVADTDNRRIQILDPEGHFKTRWKFPGWGSNSEAYLAVDADGSVYATDPGANAVVHLDGRGNEVRRWTADDTGKKFERPTGIALDPKGRALYVVNTDTSTITRLKLSAKP